MTKVSSLFEGIVRWLRSDFLGRVVFLVAGGLLWHTLSDLYSGVLGTSEAILIGSTVLLATVASATVIVTGKMSVTRVDQLATTAAVSITHVEEPIPESSSQEGYKGKIFREMEDYIRNAKRRIAVVTSPAYDGRFPGFQRERHLYLEVIEQELSRRDRKFKYQRILQIPAERADEPLEQVLADETIAHCKNMIRLSESGRGAPQVSIQWLKLERLSPYILIDDNLVVIDQDGVDPDGFLYIEGFFFVDDRGGKISGSYEEHFTKLFARSHEVTIKADTLEKA